MLTTVYSGLAEGAIYVLVGLTYNVVLAATGIFNFAQAQMVVAGAFVAYVGVEQQHWPTALTLLVCTAVGALLGTLEELVAVRPLKNSRGLGYLVTTVGAAVVVQGVAYVVWGPDPRTVSYSFGGDGPVTLLGGLTTPLALALVGLAVVCTVALHLFHTYSRWGLASRGVTTDRDLAAIRGVNVPRMVVTAFAIAGALGGFIGFFIASQVGVSYQLGDSLVIYAFLVMAVGGFGSYVGVLAAGFPIGILQSECERWLPAGSATLILFAVLLVILIIRPGGMFGRELRAV